MDVGLRDVILTISAPELMGTLWADELCNESLNLARRFGAAFVEAPHIPLGHKPVAEVSAAKQKRFSSPVDDLFALGMDELCTCRRRRDKDRKKCGKDKSAHPEAPRTTCSCLEKFPSMARRLEINVIQR